MPSFDNLAFSFTFPHVNPVCSFLLPHMCYAFRSSSITYRLKKQEYFPKIKISASYPLYSFIHNPVTFFLPDPNISLNILHPNTVTLSS